MHVKCIHRKSLACHWCYRCQRLLLAHSSLFPTSEALTLGHTPSPHSRCFLPGGLCAFCSSSSLSCGWLWTFSTEALLQLGSQVALYAPCFRALLCCLAHSVCLEGPFSHLSRFPQSFPQYSLQPFSTPSQKQLCLPLGIHISVSDAIFGHSLASVLWLFMSLPYLLDLGGRVMWWKELGHPLLIMWPWPFWALVPLSVEQEYLTLSLRTCTTHIASFLLYLMCARLSVSIIFSFLSLTNSKLLGYRISLHYISTSTKTCWMNECILGFW